MDISIRCLIHVWFLPQWTSWVMTYACLVRYAVRMNGEILGFFYPTRGLGQGDPLSPYLFLFVAEELSMALDKQYEVGNIIPIKVVRGILGIFHLLFADDSLLFFKAPESQALRVKDTISLFQQGTGQVLSPGKCSILLSQACPESARKAITCTLEITTTTFEEKYLVLSTHFGALH